MGQETRREERKSLREERGRGWKQYFKRRSDCRPFSSSTAINSNYGRFAGYLEKMNSKTRTKTRTSSSKVASDAESLRFCCRPKTKRSSSFYGTSLFLAKKSTSFTLLVKPEHRAMTWLWFYVWKKEGTSRHFCCHIGRAWWDPPLWIATSFKIDDFTWIEDAFLFRIFLQNLNDFLSL